MEKQHLPVQYERKRKRERERERDLDLDLGLFIAHNGFAAADTYKNK